MEQRIVEAKDAGERLDRWLTALEPDLSRGRWQALIKDGHVLVDDSPAKPNHALHAGSTVSFEIPPAAPAELQAEAVALDILFEDSEIIVVDKPAGLVVHPAPGHDRGTLVHALLHHCEDLRGIGGELRPGIVHRLDKDTSGVIVAAKSEPAMTSLARQFKQRKVRKEYLAVAWGHPAPAEQRIETLLGRSTHDRKKMTASPARGRKAVSHYYTIENMRETSLLRVVIETGRTHQIRVHLAHAGHPIVGDRKYGGRRKLAEPAVTRQLLHAHRLVLEHPTRRDTLEFVSPLPDDMRAVIQAQRS